MIDELVAQGLSQPAADELSRYVGILFRNEARLRETIESLSESAAILGFFERFLVGSGLTEDSPKAHLIPTVIQPDPSAVAIALGLDIRALAIEHQQIAAANLEDWGASLGMLSPEKILVVDPERGRFWFLTAPNQNVWVPVYHTMGSRAISVRGFTTGATPSRAKKRLYQPAATTTPVRWRWTSRC